VFALRASGQGAESNQQTPVGNGVHALYSPTCGSTYYSVITSLVAGRMVAVHLLGGLSLTDALAGGLLLADDLDEGVVLLNLFTLLRA
jgi:hypothetical protein